MESHQIAQTLPMGFLDVHTETTQNYAELWSDDMLVRLKTTSRTNAIIKCSADMAATRFASFETPIGLEDVYLDGLWIVIAKSKNDYFHTIYLLKA